MYLEDDNEPCEDCRPDAPGRREAFTEWLEQITQLENASPLDTSNDEDADANTTSAHKPRCAVSVTLDNHQLLATLDTGAWSPWISKSLYDKHGK